MSLSNWNERFLFRNTSDSLSLSSGAIVYTGGVAVQKTIRAAKAVIETGGMTIGGDLTIVGTLSAGAIAGLSFNDLSVNQLTAGSLVINSGATLNGITLLQTANAINLISTSANVVNLRATSAVFQNGFTSNGPVVLSSGATLGGISLIATANAQNLIATSAVFQNGFTSAGPVVLSSGATLGGVSLLGTGAYMAMGPSSSFINLRQVFDSRVYLSCKEFGAVGNGVNDDTTSIQNCINAGYSVYFPRGTYLITAPLTGIHRFIGEPGPVPSKDTYHSGGSNVAQIKCDTVSNGAGVFQFANATGGNVIQNLSFAIASSNSSPIFNAGTSANLNSFYVGRCDFQILNLGGTSPDGTKMDMESGAKLFVVTSNATFEDNDFELGNAIGNSASMVYVTGSSSNIKLLKNHMNAVSQTMSGNWYRPLTACETVGPYSDILVADNDFTLMTGICTLRNVQSAQISRNVVRSAVAWTGTEYYEGMVSLLGNNSRVVISDNVFNDVGTGLLWQRNLGTASATTHYSASYPNTGIEILNNIIGSKYTDGTTSAVNLANVSKSKIVGNTIRATAGQIAMNIDSNSVRSIQIANNLFDNLLGNYSIGINVATGTGDGYLISNNSMYNAATAPMVGTANANSAFLFNLGWTES